jgi:hypothetical protein
LQIINSAPATSPRCSTRSWRKLTACARSPLAACSSTRAGHSVLLQCAASPLRLPSCCANRWNRRQGPRYPG